MGEALGVVQGLRTAGASPKARPEEDIRSLGPPSWLYGCSMVARRNIRVFAGVAGIE